MKSLHNNQEITYDLEIYSRNPNGEKLLFVGLSTFSSPKQIKYRRGTIRFREATSETEGLKP